MRGQAPDPTPIVLAALLLAGIALMFLTSCASQQPGHIEFYKQIVRWREGHKGPTHQICAEKDWKGACQKWDLREYDLASAEVRKQFHDFQFICKVGASRYKIDPDQPRLVRYKRHRPCWLCKEEVVLEKAISYNSTAFLLAGGTYCYSEKAWPNGLRQ